MGEVSGLPGSVDELVDDFELFDDWEDRYGYLVDLGKRLPALPESERTDVAKVQGCTSQVWFVQRPTDDGRLRWDGDSDAAIVRGLIAVLHVLFDGLTPDEARALDVDGIFQRIGLERHLSVNRRNGFYAMVGRLRSWR
ncbi:MAG: SufE family protein [Alphaproteobacteria bacterium]|nr:SufE family protein [Alphaproteobacteria bacterium]